MFFTPKEKTVMPSPETALPGRTQEMIVPDQHFVLDRPLKGPFPAGVETIYFGMGCFWGGRTQVLGRSRRVYHCRRLCCWLHTQPNL